MENENLNERESLRLISDMIERAKRTEIDRLNFVTLYGILGLAVYIVTLTMPGRGYERLWTVVAAVSYGVPFVYHRMWKRPMTITGQVVKQGWGCFALVGLFLPVVVSMDRPLFAAPLMSIVLSGALFMLSGIFRNKAIMWCGFIGLAFNLLTIADNGRPTISSIGWNCVFLIYSVKIGLMIDKKADKIKMPC